MLITLQFTVWLWMQNLCSPFCESLCFIWCPVHYCQHIWKVLSLETSPILFQAGLNISRQEAENETFPQETACSAFYLVKQTEDLILCTSHLNNYIFIRRICERFLFFFVCGCSKNKGENTKLRETTNIKVSWNLRLELFAVQKYPWESGAPFELWSYNRSTNCSRLRTAS